MTRAPYLHLLFRGRHQRPGRLRCPRRGGGDGGGGGGELVLLRVGEALAAVGVGTVQDLRGKEGTEGEAKQR